MHLSIYSILTAVALYMKQWYKLHNSPVRLLWLKEMESSHFGSDPNPMIIKGTFVIYFSRAGLNPLRTTITKFHTVSNMGKTGLLLQFLKYGVSSCS